MWGRGGGTRPGTPSTLQYMYRSRAPPRTPGLGGEARSTDSRDTNANGISHAATQKVNVRMLAPSGPAHYRECTLEQSTTHQSSFRWPTSPRSPCQQGAAEYARVQLGAAVCSMRPGGRSSVVGAPGSNVCMSPSTLLSSSFTRSFLSREFPNSTSIFSPVAQSQRNSNGTPYVCARQLQDIPSIFVVERCAQTAPGCRCVGVCASRG